MKQKILQIFAGFMLAIVFYASGYAQETADAAGLLPDSERSGGFVLLNYQDALQSDQYNARRLAVFCERLASWIIPASERALKCNVIVSRTGKDYVFGAVRRGNEIRIHLAPDYMRWSKDRETVNMLVGWMVLAQLGLPPEKITVLRNHWVISALTRKALIYAVPTKEIVMPFFPASYALASVGVFPSLGSVLEPGATVFSTPVREFQDEYSELLLDAVMKDEWAKNRQITKIFIDTVAEPSVSQEELFIRHGRERLWKTALSENSVNSAEMDQWFADALAKSLLSLFMPYETAHFEKLYHQYSRWHEEASGAGGELSELPVQRDSLKDVNELVSSIRDRLETLARMSHPDFQAPLTEIRLAVSKVRTGGGEKVRAGILAAEKKLYTAIAIRVQEDYLLRRAESRFIPPRSVYDKSFAVLIEFEVENRALLPEVNALLDRWDK